MKQSITPIATVTQVLERDALPAPAPVRANCAGPFLTSGLAARALFRLKMPTYAVGLTVFAVYWVLPLSMAAFEGTLLPKDRASQLPSEFGDLFLLAPLARLFARAQVIDQPDARAYLNDFCHLCFAVILSVGAALAAHLVIRFGAIVDELRARGIPVGFDQEGLSLYAQQRALTGHRGFKCASLLAASIVFLFFLHLTRAQAHLGWWGDQHYGYAGVVFALLEMLMVYWGSQTVIVLGIGSVMLSRLMRGPLALRPFHEDGCNGLSPLGTQIVLLWLFALVLALAIFVVVRLGYLGIEHTMVGWLLAASGTLTIPALAILPLLAALGAIQRARRIQLAGFDRILSGLLHEAQQAAGEGRVDDAAKAVEQMEAIRPARGVIDEANAWPFNPRALAGILTANVIQIVLTAHELVNAFN
jgi:hypothetical protein